MTLQGRRDRPKRPPMKTSTFWIWIGSAVAAFVAVGIILAVSGQSFF